MAKNTDVDSYIKQQPVWQQANLKLFRKIVHFVYADIHEEIKWGVPVFIVNGINLLAMSSFKHHTKYNFFNGASLKENNLFNNGLDSKISRGIDLSEGEEIDENQLSRVIEESIAKVARN